MSKPRVIIEITPSRVEVALVKGTAAERCAVERFGRADWPAGAAQAQALNESLSQLTKLVGDLGVLGAQATVVYSLPGSVASLTSCAASVSAASAEQAARLALTSVADFALDDAPVDTCQLMADKPAAKGEADPAWAPQRHTLVVADAEHRVAGLVEMVEAAGVEVERLLPADAVAMAAVIREATKADTEGALAVLWVGEHSSMLGVGKAGRLLFVRPVAGGTEGLADALTRPLRPRDPDSPAVNLKHSEARTLVLAAGVPAPDAPVPGHSTLAGSSLLPHIQPLLQRLSIEVKQSARFGVPEADRAAVRVRVVGPGAAVPGLEAAVARLSGFPVAGRGEGAEPDALESSAGGLIAALLASPTLGAALMSESVRMAARRRTLRKAMLAGVVLAGAFVALQFLDARAGVSQARATLAQMRQKDQADEGPAAVRAMAFEARQAVAAAEARLTSLLGTSPDASAALAEVAQRTPEGVRILGLDLTREAGSSRLVVRAYVRVDGANDPARVIKSYVDSLSQSPVVETARLGGIQRMSMRGFDAQGFEVTLGLVSLPPTALLPEGSVRPRPSTDAQATVPVEGGAR